MDTKPEIPEWLSKRLILVPPLVPVVIGIGSEANWWEISTTLGSLIDTLAIGVLALVLGRKVTRAEAETTMRRGLDELRLEEMEQFEQREWDAAVLRELSAKGQGQLPM